MKPPTRTVGISVGQATYLDGWILSARGGFYTVRTPDGAQYACRARGLFRNQRVSPLVGDHVKIQATDEGCGLLMEIEPRQNQLTRPAVANLDLLVLVASVAEPPPNLQVLDKMIAVATCQRMEPVLAVTKADLAQGGQALAGMYRAAGYACFAVSVRSGEGVEGLRAFLEGKTSCFCGNTGAGKSSLLNALDPGLSLETGEISQKLGRGRHTTRHAQLYPLAGGGYIADTPGFSAVDLSKYGIIRKEDLAGCFREFAPYRDRCRFTGCSHTRETGCAVLEAAGAGLIAPSRMESYRALYEDARQIKDWERSR